MPGALELAAVLLTIAPATRETIQMGTYCRMTIWPPAEPARHELLDAAWTEIDRAERLLSNWRPDSELSVLNRGPIGRPVPISPLLAAVLRDAWALADLTGCAFDPAVGALTLAWDVDGAGRVPGHAERRALVEQAGRRAFLLDGHRDLVERLHPAARIDSGGFGKGLGLDWAAARLRAAGVSDAVLDLGGQVLVIGGPTEVAIAHPAHRERAIGAVLLGDASAATSGNGGRRASGSQASPGHILDPALGGPARDFGSVTVLASTGLEADALSTALFVLGPTEGLALARTLPGVDAVFLVSRADGEVEAHMTAGLASCLILDPDVVRFDPLPGSER